MSQPTFPNIDPPLERSEVLNWLISSVAYEELGLSHIINAEGEKLQFILGTQPGLTGGSATIDDALAANESVQNTLENMLSNQMMLNGKLIAALNAPAFTGPTGATAPTIYAQHLKALQTLQNERPPSITAKTGCPIWASCLCVLPLLCPHGHEQQGIKFIAL